MKNSMSEEEMENNFRFELLKTFHDQFAVNQNSNQGLFLQSVSILVTALVAYGYAFVNVMKGGISYLDFGLTLLLSVGILMLGIFLICNSAYLYRRDQIIITKIRKESKVTQDTTKTKIFAIIPNKFNFNALDGKYYFSNWMPGYYEIFFWTLLIAEIFIVFSFILKTTQIWINSICLFDNCCCIFFVPKCCLFCLCFLITLIVIIVSFYIQSKHFTKLKEFQVSYNN